MLTNNGKGFFKQISPTSAGPKGCPSSSIICRKSKVIQIQTQYYNRLAFAETPGHNDPTEFPLLFSRDREIAPPTSVIPYVVYVSEFGMRSLIALRTFSDSKLPAVCMECNLDRSHDRVCNRLAIKAMYGAAINATLTPYCSSTSNIKSTVIGFTVITRGDPYRTDEEIPTIDVSQYKELVLKETSPLSMYLL